MILVPATMELLGNKNWWLPKWIDRLLPRIEVEGHAVPGAHSTRAGEAGDDDREPELV
jgi:RND superfamily putative drug exporter